MGRTRSETLPTSSARSRASTRVAVTLSPSSPASGDVLIPTVTDRDGSSTEMTGSGRASSGSASVSPIVTSGIPATAMISPAGLLGLDPVERLGHVQLGHLRTLDGPVGATPGDLLGAPDRALKDAADGEPAHVRGGVEIRHERLQRVSFLVGRRRDALEDQVEKRAKVSLKASGSGSSDARPAFALQ